MTKTTTTPRADIYERITVKIVEQLEAGTRPWMQPWGACGTPVRPLRYNGVAYRGINKGVSELRIDYGPGYRLYFVRRGDVVLVMLCSGGKKSQKSDIVLAKKMAKETL